MFYLYGIIPTNSMFSMTVKGFNDKKIFTVPYNEICAVVSEVGDEFSQESINENVRDFEWLAKNGSIHENVIQTVMKKHTIIPSKFCTIFTDETKIIDTLKNNYLSFLETIQRINNKIEIGIKIYYDINTLKNKLKSNNAEITKLETQINNSSPGKAYFLKNKTDILLKDESTKQMAHDAKNIFNSLKKRAHASKEASLWSKKATGKDMLLNAVFLISKSDFSSFKECILAMENEYNYLSFTIAGPFSPYNFVD